MDAEDCMDEDLDALTREQLLEEVKRLRAGIRAHRDSSGHDLCWHHPDLWRLLPEPLDPRIERFRHGLSSCAAASATGSRWTSSSRRRRGPTSSTSSDR